MKDFKGKKSPIGKSTPSKPSKNMVVCKIMCIHHLDLNNTLQIQFGGMVFDADQQKAVRKRTIPPPSAMSFSGSLTYEEVLKIGKESYFPELDCSLKSFCLGDASGVLYQIEIRQHGHCHSL